MKLLLYRVSLCILLVFAMPVILLAGIFSGVCLAINFITDFVKLLFTEINIDIKE